MTWIRPTLFLDLFPQYRFINQQVHACVWISFLFLSSIFQWPGFCPSNTWLWCFRWGKTWTLLGLPSFAFCFCLYPFSITSCCICPFTDLPGAISGPSSPNVVVCCGCWFSDPEVVAIDGEYLYKFLCELKVANNKGIGMMAMNSCRWAKAIFDSW